MVSNEEQDELKTTNLGVINASVDGHGHEVVGVDEVLDVLVNHRHVVAIVEGVLYFIVSVELTALLFDRLEAVLDSFHAVHEGGQRLEMTKLSGK